jgi:hypothetical protein
MPNPEFTRDELAMLLRLARQQETVYLTEIRQARRHRRPPLIAQFQGLLDDCVAITDKIEGTLGADATPQLFVVTEVRDVHAN